VILTHEEQQQLADTPNARLVLVRNTIAAVLQKLAGVSVEPSYKAKPYSSLPTVVVSAQVDYYSRDQLTTAIAAARVQALEEAAKVCLDLELDDRYKTMISTDDWNAGTLDCDTAIRALIGKEST